jgi:hypothetical protein
MFVPICGHKDHDNDDDDVINNINSLLFICQVSSYKANYRNSTMTKLLITWQTTAWKNPKFSLWNRTTEELLFLTRKAHPVNSKVVLRKPTEVIKNSKTSINFYFFLHSHQHQWTIWNMNTPTPPKTALTGPIWRLELSVFIKFNMADLF